MTTTNDHDHSELGRYILSFFVGCTSVYPSLARKPPAGRKVGSKLRPPKKEAREPWAVILTGCSVPELSSSGFFGLGFLGKFDREGVAKRRLQAQRLLKDRFPEVFFDEAVEIDDV